VIALIRDYLQYRALAGPYDNNGKSRIPDLFDERIPDEVLAILKAGDLIWVASKNSVRSWLIMYYCGIPLSHLTTYLGDRTITHATTDSGTICQKLDLLFDTGVRFLPCRMLLLDKRQRAIIQRAANDLAGMPYSYRRIVLAWLYIVSGRNWPTFKWKFYCDFLAIYGLLSFAFPYVALSVACVHFIIILVFAFVWRFLPFPIHRRGGSLNLYFQFMCRNWMLPLVNRFGTIDPKDVVAIFREKP
jgi:hypothetical protein